MEKFISDNIMAIISIVFGAGGFFDAYRQRKKNQADALEAMQRAYDKYVDDSVARYDELRKEIVELKKSHKEEITSLKEAHKHEMQELKQEWSEKYNALKSSFENYKKRK